MAVHRYGAPEILNSYEGCQFTSKELGVSCLGQALPLLEACCLTLTNRVKKPVLISDSSITLP